TGGTPPSQILQIRNGGAGTLNWALGGTTSDGGAWLTTSAVSGTAPTSVTIGIVPANLPGGGVIEGTYTGQLVFQSEASIVTIPVSVVGESHIFSQVNPIGFTMPVGGANP